MGFKDRLMKKYMPDYPSIFGEVLGPDDKFLAYAQGLVSAYERKGRARGLEQVILHKIVDGVSNKLAKDRHLNADEDSVASHFPLEAFMAFHVLSRNGLSVYDCGMDGHQTPDLQVHVPWDAIASIVDTGKKSQRMQVYRYTFADESYIDYSMIYFDDAYLATVGQNLG